jgi:hypothetical protein
LTPIPVLVGHADFLERNPAQRDQVFPPEKERAIRKDSRRSLRAITARRCSEARPDENPVAGELRTEDGRRKHNLLKMPMTLPMHKRQEV